MQERQQAKSWQCDDTHRPEIAFDVVPVLWLMLPGGTLKQICQCNDGELRLFFARAITNHYTGKFAENIRRELLDTIDELDRYATWWIVCELIARRVPLALYGSRDDALHGRNPVVKAEKVKREKARHVKPDEPLTVQDVQRIVEEYDGATFVVERFKEKYVSYRAIWYASPTQRRRRVHLATPRTLQFMNEEMLRAKMEGKTE